jgi:hypothetical protein
MCGGNYDCVRWAARSFGFLRAGWSFLGLGRLDPMRSTGLDATDEPAILFEVYLGRKR